MPLGSPREQLADRRCLRIFPQGQCLQPADLVVQGPQPIECRPGQLAYERPWDYDAEQEWFACHEHSTAFSWPIGAWWRRDGLDFGDAELCGLAMRQRAQSC